MDELDPAALPRRALLDTNVANRAFWPEEPGHADDPRTPFCREFVRLMLRTRGTVILAAVTLAEALRFNQDRAIPRVRGILVAPFDEQAAVKFGQRLSEGDLKTVQQLDGVSRLAVRYDALIVASAIRHNAECIVSVDNGDMRAIAKRAGVLVHAPSDFIRKQTRLNV